MKSSRVILGNHFRLIRSLVPDMLCVEIDQDYITVVDQRCNVKQSAHGSKFTLLFPLSFYLFSHSIYLSSLTQNYISLALNDTCFSSPEDGGGMSLCLFGVGALLFFMCVRCFLLLIQPNVKGPNAELEPIDSWLITQGMVRISPEPLSPRVHPPLSTRP